MKFSLLHIGQRFLYQGRIYRKTTPLMADPEGAEGQRLIPRSAMVEPLDTPSPAPTPPPEIPLEQVNRAMQQLSIEINGIVAESGLNAAAVNQLLGELQGAFTRCRHNLNLP